MEELIQENDRLYGTVRKKISAHIWLQQVLSGNDFKKDWRWNLHVIIDELTTAEELRKSWVDIDTAREELKSSQGSDPKIFYISLMNQLAEQRKPVNYVKLKKKPISYGTLAKDLNFDALTYLLWLSDKKKGTREQTAGLISFVNLFHALGFKNKVIDEWEKEGREKIAQGKSPWGLSTGPITRNKVTRLLVKYNQNIKNKKIVITPLYKNSQIQTTWLFALGRGYWKQAKELLEKDYPSEFSKYSDRYNVRKLEIHQNIVRKSGLNSE